jgi:hypothetical protein
MKLTQLTMLYGLTSVGVCIPDGILAGERAVWKVVGTNVSLH